MAKDWKSKMEGLDGAVTGHKNIWATTIQTVAPSLDFCYGRGWGLPLGYTLLLAGLPKAGKSVVSKLMAAGVHRDYPDGCVIAFNTEFREEGQMDERAQKLYGIDEKRYQGIEANS